MLIYIITHKKYSNIYIKVADYIFLLISFIASLVFVYNQMIDFNTSKFNTISPYIPVYIYILLFSVFLFGIYKNIYNKKLIYIFSILGGSSYMIYLLHQFIGYRLMSLYAPIAVWQGVLLGIIIICISIVFHITLEKKIMIILKDKFYNNTIIKRFKNITMLKKNKKVVSIIWGYHTHMYNFAPEENYHLHFLKVAKESGFIPYAIVKGSKKNMESDPNFDKDIEVIDYKNIFQFLFLIIKFSFQNTFRQTESPARPRPIAGRRG